MAGGIRFGQYVLLRRIARGGMAEVFLAQQQGLEGFDRRVAVKRILPHLVDSPDFVKMFLGEAKLAAQLTHPNVVHIYDFGKVAGDYFIAMEYVEGIHAGQLWKLGEKGAPASGRLPPTLVARIGADAASALHYAHELRGPNGKPIGLVHRDVSPANLMVSFDGVVKLCDFGIAKAAAISDQLTNPGQVKGKYAYMSPEQTIAQPLDGRSDVFSLAIVLWELLSGKTIVGRADAVDSMRAIRDGKLEPITSAAPGTPKPLADAITWALETKRDRRATAADLAQALEAFIKSSPEITTPMQLAAWVRARFTRDSTGEHSTVGEGTAAAGGTAAGAGGTLASPGTQAGQSTVSAPPTSARGSIAAPIVARGGLIAASRIDPATEDSFDGAPTVSLDAKSPSAAAIRASVRPTVVADSQPSPIQTPPPGIRAPDEPTLKPGPLPRPRGRARRDPTVDPTAQLELTDLVETGERQDDDTDHDDRGGHGRDDRDDDPFDEMSDTTSRRDSGPPARPAALAPPAMFEVPSLARPSGGQVRGSASNGAAAAAAAAAASSGYPVRPRPRIDSTAAASPRRAPRVAVSVGVLLAIGVASFLIALAARSRSHASSPPAVIDAAAAVQPAARDAGAISVVPLGGSDAAAPAPDAAVAPLADAALAATAPPDAAAATTAATAGVLEVSTTPAGATITIGDQTATAPAKFDLAAGHYVVIADVRGYVAERREVDIDSGEHVAQDVVFTHKVTSPHAPPSAPVSAFGKLNVRTTPPAEVFTSAGHSLGSTPADIELPAGSHLLTFKADGHSDATRRVVITGGKTTKLTFTLP